MSTLLVNLVVLPGREDDLRAVYLRDFRPAVASQPGFGGVDLFEPREGRRWTMVLRFATEEQRLRWVATDLHGRAWGAMEERCESYDAVLHDPVD